MPNDRPTHALATHTPPTRARADQSHARRQSPDSRVRTHATHPRPSSADIRSGKIHHDSTLSYRCGGWWHHFWHHLAAMDVSRALVRYWPFHKAYVLVGSHFGSAIQAFFGFSERLLLLNLWLGLLWLPVVIVPQLVLTPIARSVGYDVLAIFDLNRPRDRWRDGEQVDPALLHTRTVPKRSGRLAGAGAGRRSPAARAPPQDQSSPTEPRQTRLTIQVHERLRSSDRDHVGLPPMDGRAVEHGRRVPVLPGPHVRALAAVDRRQALDADGGATQPRRCHTCLGARTLPLLAPELFATSPTSPTCSILTREHPPTHPPTHPPSLEQRRRQPARRARRGSWSSCSAGGTISSTRTRRRAAGSERGRLATVAAPRAASSEPRLHQSRRCRPV